MCTVTLPRAISVLTTDHTQFPQHSRHYIPRSNLLRGDHEKIHGLDAALALLGLGSMHRDRGPEFLILISNYIIISYHILLLCYTIQ